MEAMEKIIAIKNKSQQNLMRRYRKITKFKLKSSKKNNFSNSLKLKFHKF